MSLSTAATTYITLAKKVASGSTARGENDLSSNLAAVFGSLGLFTVIDTSVAKSGRKRPDILGYVSSDDADLVLPADFVIESKKPAELSGYASIADAVVGDLLWEDKTYSYICSNITRIQYFILTTFSDFGIVTITPELRSQFVHAIRGTGDEQSLKAATLKSTLVFHIASALPKTDPQSSVAWETWIKEHLSPAALKPISLSIVHNTFRTENRKDLENFATRLADLAAGVSEDKLANAGLFHSIRSLLPLLYRDLPTNVQRDLHIFLMTQHPGMTSAAITTIAKDKTKEVLTEFVAASIHSLIGRMFAFKAVGDVFCIHEKDPLIEKELWVFSSARYDGCSSEEIRTRAFAAIRNLKSAATPAIKQFAVYGFFFDWIENFIDPVLFRSLFEMFVSRDFEDIKGDLLGRFFEIYSQKINRTKRKALGQYYTPQPVVEMVWHVAFNLVRERGAAKTIEVLDPSMGSGTFLTEGARLLAAEGIPRFWEHLTGFDISAQVLGIAYVNFYVAILSHLSRREATTVGDLHVYATDTLDPRNGKYLREILPLVPDPEYKQFIEQRIKISAEVKQTGSFTLVIGNPPYRNNSQLVLSQVAAVFPRLLTAAVEGARAQVRNIRDDYAWFFAAADHYVSNRGVIAFIVSDSFAQHLSYRYFREDLLKNYHIRHLIRLGESVFQDVSPRISFVIVVLEKRAVALESADASEAHPYNDLRGLIALSNIADLGGELDPRFVVMGQVIRGQANLPTPQTLKPARDSNFSLYPSSSIMERVKQGSVAVFQKSDTRLFSQKWPGLITAFDELLKGNSREVLEAKMESFFLVSQQSGLSAARSQAVLEQWSLQYDIGDESLPRLEQLSVQIRQKGLTYSASLVKRAMGGAMPNSSRWYPPNRNTMFIYYDTILDIPRNQNEGKDIGWGSMQQWREPQSHLISPKLVYTTASKPQYGLKAFVLDEEWYVKLHGGTSQQYNYTGISYSGQSERMDNLPNNLTDQGLSLLQMLAEENLTAESLNFYVASLYNSALAADFFEQAGSGTPFKIKMPSTPKERALAGELARVGKKARDLAWLHALVEGRAEIDAPYLDSRFRDLPLSEIGLTRSTNGSKRFKADDLYLISPNTNDLLCEREISAQEEIDELASDLYT